jgi:ABC-2 type transport system permease protein
MNTYALFAHTRLETRLLLRRWDVIFFSVFMPVTVMLFFGSMYGNEAARQDMHLKAMNFMLPGYVVMAVMSVGLASLGFMLATERQYGILKRLGATPLSRTMLLLGKMGASSLIIVAATSILLAIGVFGYGVSLQGNPLAMTLVIAAGTAVFSLMGLTVAGLMRADSAAAATNAIYMGMTVLGGTLFPLSQMPDAIQQLGEFTPSYQFMSALTGIMIEGKGLYDVGGNLLGLLAWGVVCLLIAVRTFRWE